MSAQLRNGHIPADFLAKELFEELKELGGSVGEPVQLEWLGRQKTGEDTTTKVLVRTARNEPIAVVVCSRAAAPALVERGVDVAERIRTLVGDDLGQAIAAPLSKGWVDGRSYMVLPYYHEFSRFRAIRYIQRLRLQPQILAWLRTATLRAADALSDTQDASKLFRGAILHLQQQPFLSDSMRRVAERSSSRIENGAWSPAFTFDHNDFWIGNIMRITRRADRDRGRYPFVIIDWSGANPTGFGVYDLVRFALSTGLSSKTLLTELRLHAEALGCELQDTRGHLLAALGRLHVNLEHFPEARYVRTMNMCWHAMDAALGEAR